MGGGKGCQTLDLGNKWKKRREEKTEGERRKREQEDGYFRILLNGIFKRLVKD